MSDFTSARLAELRGVAEALYFSPSGLAIEEAAAYHKAVTPREVLALIDALEAERSHMQSLAKWVGVDETTPSLEIACEASTALEAKTADAVVTVEMIAETVAQHGRMDDRLAREIAEAVHRLYRGETDV